MRPHYALDALDSYAKIADEATRTVPNPAKAKAKKASAAARSALGAAQAALATAVAVAVAANPTATSPAEATMTIAAATATLEAARAELIAAAKAVRALPTRVPLGDIHPDAVLADPERKRITDVIRMATYNAESALTRAVTPHYRRADDEAHSLLRETFRASGDIEVIGDCLHVRLDGLSAPRRTRAIDGLCNELNATETLYPGTNLRLVYSVKTP